MAALAGLNPMQAMALLSQMDLNNSGVKPEDVPAVVEELGTRAGKAGAEIIRLEGALPGGKKFVLLGVIG